MSTKTLPLTQTKETTPMATKPAPRLKSAASQSTARQGGFGSKLINRGMSVNLGGSIEFHWSPEGVIVTLRMSKARLAM